MAAENLALRVRRSRWISGAGVGAVAFALGYLLTYLQTSRIGASISEGFLGDATAFQPPIETVIGWFFLNAHFVRIRHGGSAPGPGRPIDYVTMMEGTSPLLFLVPPVLLLGAGAVIGFLRPVEGRRGAMWTGVSLVPGYLTATVVLVSVATVEFTTTMGGGGGTGIAGPDAALATFHVGVFYPFVFGSLGAGLVAPFAARRS